MPSSISIAAMLFIATEQLFFSSNEREVLAVAAWMLFHKDCSEKNRQINADCEPDPDNFGCLMCGARRDYGTEIRRIWNALPDDRRYFINRVLFSNGMTSKLVASKNPH
jgi:hypothetical protein